MSFLTAAKKLKILYNRYVRARILIRLSWKISSDLCVPSHRSCNYYSPWIFLGLWCKEKEIRISGLNPQFFFFNESSTRIFVKCTNLVIFLDYVIPISTFQTVIHPNSERSWMASLGNHLEKNHELSKSVKRIVFRQERLGLFAYLHVFWRSTWYEPVEINFPLFKMEDKIVGSSLILKCIRI